MDVGYSKSSQQVKPPKKNRVLEGDAGEMHPAFGWARIRVEKAEEKRIAVPGEDSDQPGSHVFLEEKGSVRYPITGGLYGEALFMPGDEVFVDTSANYTPVRLPEQEDGHVRLLIRLANIFAYKSAESLPPVEGTTEE